jgi:hypothetical protein
MMLADQACTATTLWTVSSSEDCHHGMARPRVADREDGLQIWREAANMLNKQTRIADSGWSSSLGVRQGANSPPL